MNKIAIFMPLAAGACWGASGIFVRTLGAADFDSVTVMFSRAITGSFLVFLFLLFYDKSLLKIRLRHLPLFVSLAINGYLLMNTCYNYTVGKLTLSLASVLLGLCPIFVLLLGAILFREKITLAKVCCMLAALTGCALLAGVFEKDAEVTWSLVGILSGLGSAFFNAIYTINSKQLSTAGYNALTINFYAFFLTALALLPFADFEMFTGFVTADPAHGIAFYLAQALVTSIMPNFLYTSSMERVDSGSASILSCGAEPVSAMIFGILIYSEIPSALGIIGMIITISALGVLTRAGKSKENAN